MAVQLAEDIVELIASGVDVYVATRDSELEPESMFAMGIRPHPDRTAFTVYLPEALAQRTCQNLRDNGDIAVTLERPTEVRAFQLKGRSYAIRPSNDRDRELQLVFRAALTEQFAAVGVPRSITRRLVWWPSLAVDVRLREVFSQSPGPSAGHPMLAG